MSGIKDLHHLLYWFDNSKRDQLESVLLNRRKVSKEKASIVREVEGGQRPPENRCGDL